eukprot:scaffold4204_cov140-Cylindrotheca_fusiformis.AAC.8
MIRIILAVLLLVQINAFVPARQSSFSPAISIKGAQPPSVAYKASFTLHMSEEEKKPTVSADGTFYDDELDSAPKKEGLSETMRERLVREASTGLDADKKQPNVILYISIAVAILVILGGQGIFY